MSTRRANLVALVAAAVFFATGLLAASGQEADAEPAYRTTGDSINFAGFLALSEEVMAYRQDRLVSLEAFKAMAAEPNTIILDTRSAEAFAAGHIAGAVNLVFSDMTELKLAGVIPERDTRILIYCNNNFADNAEPVPAKSPPLALNVPTFVNLYGYGYPDIYELGELVTLNDPRVGWVSPELVAGPVDMAP